MKPKLLHFSSSFFPRIGGYPAAIRSIACYTSDVFEHHLVTRDLWRAGITTARMPTGADSSDPNITVHRFKSNGAYLTPDMQQFIQDFDYDVLMIHSGHVDLMEAVYWTHKPKIAYITKTTHAVGEHLARLAHLIVFEPAEIDYFVEHFDVDRTKISALPRLVDFETFRRRDKGRHRLLYVGRIAPEKRVWVLIDLLAELRQRDKRYTLHIVGDYDHPIRDEPPLMKAIVARGLESFVTFETVYTEDAVAQVYEWGDILVSASKRESFCQVFLEALASGLPVVTTAEGGVRDWAWPYVTFTSTPGAVGEMGPLVEQAAYPSDGYEELKQGYSWQVRKAEFVEVVRGVL